MPLQRFLADLDPVMWEAGDWTNRLALEGITNIGTNSYTLAEQAAGGAGIRRGRVTHTAGAEGNDRRLYLLPDYARDDHLVIVLQSKPLVSAGGCQLGGALRVRRDSDGFMRGWLFRHDFIFAQDALIQAGVWRWQPGGFGNDATLTADVESASGTLSGLQRIVTAAAASRTANVVTATGLSPVNGDPNGLVAGHTISVDFPDNSYDGQFVVATAPAGGTTATWNQVAADDPGAGAGTINDFDGVYPLVLEGLLIGQDFAVRGYRLATQTPPSWTDETRAIILHATGAGDPYPGQPGRAGYYLGHLDTAGVAEFGYLERRRRR
jgi:hypothetical protein